MDSDDELELIEEHDLELTSQDSRSDNEARRRTNTKSKKSTTKRRNQDSNCDPFASDNDDDLVSASDQEPDPYGSQQEDGETEQSRQDSHFQLLKATVIDITSALGGLEERMDDNGKIISEYIIGDDCLREYLRILTRFGMPKVGGRWC